MERPRFTIQGMMLASAALCAAFALGMRVKRFLDRPHLAPDFRLLALNFMGVVILVGLVLGLFIVQIRREEARANQLRRQELEANLRDSGNDPPAVGE
jgi:hypothetical protein